MEIFLMDYDWQNNVSTIAVLLYGVLSPYLAQYLSAEEFSALAIAIVSIVLIVWSAKHPNTFESLGNGKNECFCNDETVLNDDYELDPNDDDGGA